MTAVQNIWTVLSLPPKYSPAAVHILHCPWCMPVSEGLVISILTSAISPGLSMSTDTLPWGPNCSPDTNRRLQPNDHGSSPAPQTHHKLNHSQTCNGQISKSQGQSVMSQWGQICPTTASLNNGNILITTGYSFTKLLAQFHNCDV